MFYLAQAIRWQAALVGLGTGVVLMVLHWATTVLTGGKRLHRLICYSIGILAIGLALEILWPLVLWLSPADYWLVAAGAGLGTLAAWGIDALAALLKDRAENEVRRDGQGPGGEED